MMIRASIGGGRQQRLEAGRDTAAARFHADGAHAAEHRDGVGLVSEAQRVRGQFVAVDPHDVARVAAGGAVATAPARSETRPSSGP